MTEFRCPKHPSQLLAPVLAGGAGFCQRCALYTQAAGVPEPKRERPRLSEEEARRVAAKRSRERRNEARKLAAISLPSLSPAARHLSRQDQRTLQMVENRFYARQITVEQFQGVRERVLQPEGKF